MRMKTQNNIFTIFHILAHILNLAGKHMGHGHLYRTGQIDNCLVVCCGLPYIQNRIHHLQGIINLCTGKAFRAVLKSKVTFGFLCKALQKGCTINSNLLDFFLTLAEYLLPLCQRSGVIYMNDRTGSTLYGFKGFTDNMFSRLSQYLDGNILGNHILFDQCAKEVILGFGSSGETNFNLLKANLYQHLEKLQFFIQTHGFNQSLIAVTQVNAAPDGSFINIVFLYPVKTLCGR